ncbi:MAG: XRE family transcriptional regulator [Anaerolineales bacterium]|jgi:transcriptional regulator with XRE-family HTH domain
MPVESDIGRRLRQRRQEIGISLRKLAQMTDLTASFLSQVERGKANLSLNSLHRIARMLDVSLLYFLEDSKSDENEMRSQERNHSQALGLMYSPVVRSDSRSKLVLPPSGVEYELLVPSLGRKMVALFGKLSPGSENIARRLPLSTEEIIYVISGSLLIGLDSGDYILNANDTIYFEGEQLQKIVCASTDQEATWISIITPAIF